MITIEFARIEIKARYWDERAFRSELLTAVPVTDQANIF